MKKLKLLLLTVLLPALAVSLWGFVTLRNNKPNGFHRNIIDGFATYQDEYRSSTHLTVFAGSSSYQYFFRTSTPDIIIGISKNLKDANLYKFDVDSLWKFKRSFRTFVDTPNVYLFSGSMNKVLIGSLGQSQMKDIQIPVERFFTDAYPISPEKYLIRTYDTSSKDFLLKLYDHGTQKFQSENNISLLKHQLGVNTQLTILADNTDQSRFYLVYMLLNSIVSFDTSMNRLYHAHTIDTIANPNLGITKLKVGEKTTGQLSSAPKYTNYKAALSKNAIYVYSKIKADNDPDNLPTIDVYRTIDGQYQFSFHLPGNIKALNDLIVEGSQLTVIDETGKRVLRYQLQQHSENILAKIRVS